MSKFIRQRPSSDARASHIKATERVSGFTEAELEAAAWASQLVEVRANYARTTNAERRGLPEAAAPVPGRPRPASQQQPPSAPAPRTLQQYLDEAEGAAAASKPTKAGKADKAERKRLKKERKAAKAERKAAKQRGGTAEALDNDDVSVLLHMNAERAEAFAAIAKRPGADAALAAAVAAVIDEAAAAAAAEQGLPPPVSVPRDPANPLGEAHNIKAYQVLVRRRELKAKLGTLRRERRLRRRRKGSSSSSSAGSSSGRDSLVWDHRGYIFRSPSPCRLRTDGAFAETRKAAWRSRAGGVYLPPTAAEAAEARQNLVLLGAERFRAGAGPRLSASRSPARYLYPEELRERNRETRRSPSYKPEDHDRPSPLSERSKKQKKKKDKKKDKKKGKRESGSGASPRSRSRGLGGRRSPGRRDRSRQRRSRSSSRSRSRRDRASPVYEPVAPAAAAARVLAAAAAADRHPAAGQLRAVALAAAAAAAREGRGAQVQSAPSVVLA